MRALCSPMEEKIPRRGSMRALCSLVGGAACVHCLLQGQHACTIWQVNNLSINLENVTLG